MQAIYKYERTRRRSPGWSSSGPRPYFQLMEARRSRPAGLQAGAQFHLSRLLYDAGPTKKNNRRLENLLLTAEKFSSIAVFRRYRPYYPDRDLDDAWKIVLRKQFHDILDGSGIGPVYEEARRLLPRRPEEARRAGPSTSRSRRSPTPSTREARGGPLIVFQFAGLDEDRPCGRVAAAGLHGRAVVWDCSTDRGPRERSLLSRYCRKAVTARRRRGAA